MRLRFKYLIVIFLFSFFTFPNLLAQKTRWPLEIEGSIIGKGVPKVWTYGYNPNAITSINENKEGRKPKKRSKPAIIHFLYEAFDASQIAITETYNPGAISKVVIGYKPKNGDELLKKTVWEGDARPSQGKYTVRNIHFEFTQKITDVWITVNYLEVEGLNQIGGVCLVNSTIDFYPQINLPKKEIFTKNVFKLNDDVDGEMNPKGLIISADGRYIFFSNEEGNNEKIYRGEFDSIKNITKVTLSEFNLPYSKSKTCGLVGINQDNNIAYVSNMLLNKFQFYKTFLGKSLFGKPKWKYELNKIENYKNGGIYIDYVMSYDGNILILGYKEKNKHGKTYNEDLYVSLKNKKGKWSNFKNMGFDLNTLGSEAPCFLASDNKTLYFVSNGMIGYGEGDIFVSKLLDDSWTNWSEPINLGPNINSSEHENSFVIDPLSNKVFFIRWKSDELSDIYSLDVIPLKIEKPVEKVEVVFEKTIPVVVDEEETMPESVIVVSGITKNKKTEEPIQAEIIYKDIFTGAEIGNAISNAETGEYTIILRKGTFYSFDAIADGFISESYSLNTTSLKDFGKIIRDYMLSPIEKNQTIRLNNIFFDTDMAELLPASFLEIDKMIAMLNQNLKIKIEIGGHTDDVASDSYNQKLSQRRAEAVKEYLTSKGVSSDRIVSKGYGESKPCVLNDCPENRARNRRVELTILEVE